MVASSVAWVWTPQVALVGCGRFSGWHPGRGHDHVSPEVGRQRGNAPLCGMVMLLTRASPGNDLEARIDSKERKQRVASLPAFKPNIIQQAISRGIVIK